MPAGSTATGFGIVDRKKQTSGPRPDPSQRARKEPSTGAVDESWDNLSGDDLVELGDIGIGDLIDQTIGEEGPGELAPVRAGGGRGPARSTLPDLPAPVGPTSSRAAGKGGRNTQTDLPAPVGPTSRRNIPDLPTPVGPRATRPSPTPPTQPAVAPPGGPGESTAPPRTAHPEPAAPPRTARPEPATRPRAARPEPAAPPRSARSAVESIGPAAMAPIAPIALPDEIDLPQPVGPSPTKQLPDLMAPVGPGSRSTFQDLPAPKGFFDDGVQPKSNSGMELPAPKGFFDDGVQPRLGSHPLPGAEPLDVDFSFEVNDSPSRARIAPPPSEPPIDFDGGGPTPSIAPAFDLGEPVASGGVNRPFGLDADDLDLEAPSEVTPPPLSLELSDGPLSSGGRAPRSRTSRMEMEMGPPGEPPHPIIGSSSSAGVTFGRPSGAMPSVEPSRVRTIGTSAAPSSDPFAPTRGAGHMLTTEIQLEVDRGQPGAPALPASVQARTAPTKAAVAPRARKQARPRASVAARRRLALLAITLVAGALVAGGYNGWNWWKARQSRNERAATGLRQVEKRLSDDAPRHWEEAAADAARIAKGNSNDLEALAVVAESSFAAALDESPQAAERIQAGDQALGTLRAKSARGPHASKAEALRAILSTNFAQAVKTLDEVKAKARTDSDVHLYLGWAQAAQEDHVAAVAAYKAAVKGKPRIPALYGLGLSQLELGDKDGATKSFQTVIQISRDRYKRDHLGALIGLAQLAPINERSSRYQELLERPDLAGAPPRAVSRLRTLAGDEALRAGRLEQARARYDEARALDPLNLRASVGLALVASRAGDLASARNKLTEDVLAAAPDHIEGALALVEVAMADKSRDEAAEIVDGLFARKPPIASATLLGRAFLARARVSEAIPDPAAQTRAEADYREAMKRADPGDFAATVGLSSLLTRLGRKQEAIDVLGPIKAAAKADPDLALTLGSAYMTAGQPEAAAESFRSVLAQRPDDAEARFQLGSALLMVGQFEAAIESLRRAYEIDPSREDIGLGLARTLEAAGRPLEAIAAYQAMLGGDRKPSLTVRGQAGRAFARLGMPAEAYAQGDAIRAEDLRDPAGQFLLGEKLFGQGKYEDALKAYRDSLRGGPEAQYNEALGRTSEKLAQYDDALHSFGDAIAADPRYLAPRLGRGRVRLVRREFALAVTELLEAQKIAPDSAPVLRDLGRAYVEMRDTARGVPLLERAVQLDDSDATAHYELGKIYYEQERSRLAATHLSKAVELATESTSWRAEGFRRLGYAQRASGNRSGAISAWRRYLTIDRIDGPARRDTERMLMRLEAR
jgi:tetratricopeptide (TPR) repeat protein